QTRTDIPFELPVPHLAPVHIVQGHCGGCISTDAYIGAITAVAGPGEYTRPSPHTVSAPIVIVEKCEFTTPVVAEQHSGRLDVLSPGWPKGGLPLWTTACNPWSAPPAVSPTVTYTGKPRRLILRFPNRDSSSCKRSDTIVSEGVCRTDNPAPALLAFQSRVSRDNTARYLCGFMSETAYVRMLRTHDERMIVAACLYTCILQYTDLGAQLMLDLCLKHEPEPVVVSAIDKLTRMVAQTTMSKIRKITGKTMLVTVTSKELIVPLAGVELSKRTI
ncbi:hypothetical protein SARC_08325, partial [Sphaeroforma arctica JP610]